MLNVSHKSKRFQMPEITFAKSFKMSRITLLTQPVKLFSFCLILPLFISLNYFLFTYSLEVAICVFGVFFNLILQSYFLEFLSWCERMQPRTGSHIFRLSMFEYTNMDRDGIRIPLPLVLTCLQVPFFLPLFLLFLLMILCSFSLYFAAHVFGVECGIV